MNVASFMQRRPRGKVHVPTVTLAHGGGGKAMKDLIDDVFVAAFDNPLLAPLDDQARLDLAALAGQGNRLAFTQACAYPDGAKVFCVAVVELADGRIAQQTVVQAWDE